MSRVSIASFAGILFAIALSTVGLAEDLSQTCKADTRQFCASIQPGDRRLFRCLRQNKAKLSSPCRTPLETAMQRMRACRSIARRFCPGVQFGGATVQYLPQHQSDLFPDCASHMASMPGADQNGQPCVGEQPLQ